MKARQKRRCEVFLTLVRKRMAERAESAGGILTGFTVIFEGEKKGARGQ